MSVVVRRVGPNDRVDLETFVALQNAVAPDWPASLEQMAWADATYPGGGRFLAEVDGHAIGCASTGRIWVHEASYPDWWLELVVVPGWRRRGVGTMLLGAASELAQAAGKSGFQVPCSDARPEGAAFLRQHGFAEFERAKAVRLDLAGLEPPEVVPPAGVRLVTLADRPDLVPAVHDVARRTFSDIPGGDPMEAGDLETFRARDVDRPGIRPDAFVVALDGERAAGYASLIIEDGRPTVGVHDMTAVVPEWRGRGLATTLKRATIRWAIEAGFEALETGNDEANQAMRAVNERLGYRPLPDLVFYRGPLLADAQPRAVSPG